MVKRKLSADDVMTKQTSQKGQQKTGQTDKKDHRHRAVKVKTTKRFKCGEPVWDEMIWCGCFPWNRIHTPETSIVQSERHQDRWTQDLEWILLMPGVLQTLGAASRESLS